MIRKAGPIEAESLRRPEHDAYDHDHDHAYDHDHDHDYDHDYDHDHDHVKHPPR